MIRTGLLNGLVVRQGLTRRIYGAADAGLVICRSLRDLSYRSNACPPRELVSCNYGGFIPGVCSYVSLRDVAIPRGIIDRPFTLTDAALTVTRVVDGGVTATGVLSRERGNLITISSTL